MRMRDRDASPPGVVHPQTPKISPNLTPSMNVYSRMESSTRRAQKSTCDRLSSPSLRQLRVARQRAEEQDRMCLGQLRLSLPYCPGQSLDQRSRQIKEVLREDWVHLGSPLPRSPISPQLLSATGRWGVSSRGSMARPHTSSPYLGA